MNRRKLLKRLFAGTAAVVTSPTILAEQSQVATTESVERMRIGSNPHGSHFIIIK